MKNLLFTFICILLSSQVYSQSLEYDWVIGTSSDSMFASYSRNIMVDNSNNCKMQFNYTSFSPVIFSNYTFPVDSDFISIGVEPANDTSLLLSIMPNGEIEWEADIYGDYRHIDNITDQNHTQIIYPDLYSLNSINSFSFGGTTIYGYNYNNPNQSSDDHLIITDYNSLGEEEWACFISGDPTISGSYTLESDANSNLYFTTSFKNNLYYNDSLIYSTADSYFTSSLLKLDQLGNLINVNILSGNGSGNTLMNVITIDNNDIVYCILTSYSGTSFYNGQQLPTSIFNNPSAWFARIDTTGNIISVIPLPPDMGILEKVINGEYYTHRWFTGPFITQGNDTIYNPSSGNALAIIKLDSTFNPIWTNVYGNVGFGLPFVEVNNNGFTFVSINHYSVNSPVNGEIIMTPNDTIASFNSPIISVIDAQGDVLDTKVLAPHSYLELYVGAMQVTDNNYVYFRGNRVNLTYSSNTFYYNEDTIIESENLFISTYLFKLHLEFPEELKQEIDLNQGWNIWSTYMEPDSPSIVSVLAPIVNNTLLAKDQDGFVYWPQFNINFIGDITIGEAYFTKVDTTLALFVPGIPVVPELTPISLNQNWNLLGYLKQDTASIDSMLIDITPNVIIAKDDDGDVFWPQFNVNNIGNMTPGEGYLIKVAQTDTLFYPPN